jgi:hypothetical protein
MCWTSCGFSFMPPSKWPPRSSARQSFDPLKSHIFSFGPLKYKLKKHSLPRKSYLVTVENLHWWIFFILENVCNSFGKNFAAFVSAFIFCLMCEDYADFHNFCVTKFSFRVFHANCLFFPKFLLFVFKQWESFLLDNAEVVICALLCLSIQCVNKSFQLLHYCSPYPSYMFHFHSTATLVFSFKFFLLQPGCHSLWG